MGVETMVWMLLLPLIFFQGAGFPPAPPDVLQVQIRENAGVPRIQEGLASGLPLPRSLQVTDLANLALLDDQNQPVPAQFHALARWDAPLEDGSAALQWVLAVFLADLPASTTRTFTLITNGSVNNPPVANPISLQVQSNGTQIIGATIDTGVAHFAIDSSGAVLSSIVVQGVELIHQAPSELRLFDSGDTNPQTFPHAALDRLEIERQDSLRVVILLHGSYSLPPRGDSPAGRITTLRRLVFYAGSGLVRVRHVVRWLGSSCDLAGEWPYYACDEVAGQYQTLNGQHLLGMPQKLFPAFSPETSLLRASSAQPSLLEAFPASMDLQQQLRSDRFQPRHFDLSTSGGASQSGGEADRAYLALHGASHSLAVALDHMHCYEPQSLRLQADGTLNIGLIDGDAWLGPRMGLFTHYGILAMPHGGTPPSGGEIESRLWAPVNHPLRAWPGREWFAASAAVDAFPWGDLTGDLQLYDQLLPRVLQNTLDNMEYKGLHGLNTYGSLPRYWSDPMRSDELDCGTDPTPGYSWDNAFWCGLWTDYHNAFSAAPIWAFRSGETQWLDELAFPAAWRMLYTQIMQCDPGDPWFYCGQSPAGYQAFRADFNGSHAYLDNLLLYYFLSGDQSVVQTLLPGALSMRDFLCALRPAAACGPEIVPGDLWASLTGRTASQWNLVLRALGLSGDSSLLADYHQNLGRAFTQFYVQQTAEDDGRDYGFLLSSMQGAWPYWCPPWRDPNNPEGNAQRRYISDQLWMASLYDFRILDRLMLDGLDTPIGQPPLSPSTILAAWARTLSRFGGNSLGAAGDPNGDWPNQLELLYDESARIGGLLSDPCSTDHPPDNPVCINRDPPSAASLPASVPSAPCVLPSLGGGDPLLYDTGKSTLAASLVLGGLLAEDQELLQLGRAFTLYALDVGWSYASATGGNQTLGSPYGMALNKILGEVLARLHPAVALLAAHEQNANECDYPNLAGDSVIDMQDLQVLVAQWQQAPQAPAEDRNGNGIIDVHELVGLLNCF